MTCERPKNLHTLRHEELWEQEGPDFHSEADTTTSFFGVVKVDSFTQELLQKNGNVTNSHKLIPCSSMFNLWQLIAFLVT